MDTPLHDVWNIVLHILDNKEETGYTPYEVMRK